MTTAVTEMRQPAALAADMGVPAAMLEPYGDGVAKIKLEAADALQAHQLAKYVLMTAVTPTPFGEGKTVTAIGLGDGLRHIGRRAVVTLRQSSMGPTFGVKGGGAGGGRSRLVPFDRVLLQLTGDMHAVTSAHNLLAAMFDNHLFHGNPLGIDASSVTWPRVLDIDDRALRNIVIGLGGHEDGIPRQAGFEITAASEVMAILALCSSLQDLRERLGRIVVGTTLDGEPVTAESLRAAGAMAVIMHDAVKPNLVQTAEGTPVLVHAGPFGNIAHGNSSVIADRFAIHGADVVVTEAGFGADMGAERFFNIKCRVSGLRPDAAVIVATVRALKVHSGKYHVASGHGLPAELGEEHPEDVVAGAVNLERQVDNVRRHGIPAVIAINAMPADHPSEVAAVAEVSTAMRAHAVVSTSYADGGAGAAELAEAVLDAADQRGGFTFLYPDSMPLEQKIVTVAREMYGAAGVEFAPTARGALERCERDGYGRLPICIAKTHLSLSHDPALVGAPSGYMLPIHDVHVSAGAGFVYALAGDVTTMPGLPTHPAAEHVDVDQNGNPIGLF
jgi:formate--tetrahydrofolate ligase